MITVKLSEINKNVVNVLSANAQYFKCKYHQDIKSKYVAEIKFASEHINFFLYIIFLHQSEDFCELNNQLSQME